MDVTIDFGESFDSVIKEMTDIAQNMNLIGIARNSKPGGLLDIKKDYPNTGRLLNGKYVSSRSAGNYLAGYNAQGGSIGGIVSISFETFQRLAGALHVKGSSLSKNDMGRIVLFNEKYGDKPYYGENYYQFRMSKKGWDASKNK